MGGHCWQDGGSKGYIYARYEYYATKLNHTTVAHGSARTDVRLRSEVGALTPRLEQVVHTLEWVRIEEFVSSTWKGCGRSEHDRGMLANAFVTKAVLRLPTTAGLIERLAVDRALKRICEFSMWKKLPGESIFSRAFAEFAKGGLAACTNAALVR